MSRAERQVLVGLRRGEIWWASLPPPAGRSSLGFRRPVLVIQANPFNESRIGTVIIAAVTSNLALAEARGHLRLGAADSGLMRPSVANASLLLTVDRKWLTERGRPLPAEAMRRVDDRLRMALAL